MPDLQIIGPPDLDISWQIPHSQTPRTRGSN
jgi:hypothetical protein